MFNSIGVVVMKELKRVFTDKRLVFTTLLLPPLMLMIIYWIMGMGLSSFTSDIEEHKSSVYIMNAPESFETMMQGSPMELHVLDNNERLTELKGEIKEGTADLIIEFDPEFNEKVSEYMDVSQKPYVNTYYNSSEEYSSSAYNQIIGVLNGYEEMLLGERLGTIEYASVFEIDPNNAENIIVDDEKAGGKIVSMIIPMLLTIFLFAGSMGIGADSIAGEKERGTMATLLLTPVKREVIALGKVISLAIIAFSSAFTTFLGIFISLPMLLKSAGDMSFSVGDLINYGIFDYILILLVLLAMEGVFVGLISIASVISKSVKEASTYMMPIYILVMIAAYANIFKTGVAQLWEYAIPVYGSVVALKDVFGFTLNIPGLILNVIVSIAFTGILIYIVKKLFDSEKVMFSA